MSEVVSEVDERRIAEWAQKPSQVLRGGAGPAALDEARKVLEWQALTRRRKQDPSAQEDDGS
ncbi:hypothetical protein HRW12_00730 [Streptomyces lunaelactis]|uniref:hypothetical protein n=1 Tax=Streptomyces lunaelactis TaxID=1535768 RepID=UPI001584B011|nr:hypothetical protein [Streptomyces lunaelactis]NUK32323.1 hypothetical protein [Streptomyces lunaelactis]NUK40353.1 hypothetical protein [Streptomyces lunaelactis]